MSASVWMPERYPFYKHSQAAFFLAYRDDLPVGRLAVLDNCRYNDYNQAKDAFFYLFECEPDLQAARDLVPFSLCMGA